MNAFERIIYLCARDVNVNNAPQKNTFIKHHATCTDIINRPLNIRYAIPRSLSYIRRSYCQPCGHILNNRYGWTFDNPCHKSDVYETLVALYLLLLMYHAYFCLRDVKPTVCVRHTPSDPPKQAQIPQCSDVLQRILLVVLFLLSACMGFGVFVWTINYVFGSVMATIIGLFVVSGVICICHHLVK